MSILPNGEDFGHIPDALNHYNRACRLRREGSSPIDVARSLADCLNKLQAQWLLSPSEEPSSIQLGEVKAFQLMVLGELKGDKRKTLLYSTELQRFADLEPQIMNHHTLNRNRYVPGTMLGSKLYKEATEEHRKLSSALEEFKAGTRPEETVIKRTSELMYIVRSNIAHGEKTPFGPDFEKSRRDERVCELVVPLQYLLCDLLLERPSSKLLVYGTLAPGQANHSVIAGLLGTWSECSLRGVIQTSGAFRALSVNVHGDRVEAQLFSSDELSTYWEQLDRFEGAAYTRCLVLISTGGKVMVSNAYLDAQMRG